MSAEARFLELLPTIDRLSAALCRRRGLDGADAEDFAASVRARFVESEYAAIRQVRGDASITTYLAVVIASWLKDHLVARDGRWRPSAAALRLGPVAVQLERLVTRGRRSADEAVTELLAGDDQPYTERELRAMLRELPAREPLRPEQVSTEAASELPDVLTRGADARVVHGEHDLAVARARSVLEAALQTLDAEDRLLVSMRFLDGRTIAEIARVLGVEQKPLYRRVERALRTLREQLTASGLTREAVRDLVSEAE